MTNRPMQARTKSPSYQSINPELYAEERSLLVQGNSPSCESAIACPQCKKVFVDTKTLQRHSAIHRGLRPFTCQDCGKTFMLRGDLTRHLLIHSGKRPYSCHVCQRRFTLKGNLMQHVRTHTPEKQFVCTVCRKCFTQRESLYRHIRAHFGEKPYGCETCGKGFSLRGDLTRHIMIHTGQKPHLCPICGRPFALKGNMMQHMRTHNNCIELMTLRDAEENKNTILNFEEHAAAMNRNPADKQIWQVTETANPSNSEHKSATEAQINVHYPSKGTNGEIIKNDCHECSQETGIPPPPTSVPSQRPQDCNFCIKTGVSEQSEARNLTYLNPVRPPNGSLLPLANDALTSQPWSQNSIICSMCGKSFKNRRNLKLHVERHKIAHTEFKCNRCLKSFLSKSEQFFHSCRGIQTSGGNSGDPGAKPEHCNVASLAIGILNRMQL